MDEFTSSSVDRGAKIRQPRFSSSHLSSSEPSLRFPRPQGDRRLANWVSSSQPDIMTADPNVPAPDGPEESGLMSDSTYEVINNTDTESQDELPAGSVCSSDYLQGDDVQSLVSTEYTGDDNDVDVDEGQQSDASEGIVLPSQAQDAGAEQSGDEVTEAHNTHSGSEDEQTKKSLHVWSQDRQEPQDAPASTSAAPRQSLDDEKTRESALQYAEESLETPSASVHEIREEREKRLAKLADLHRLLDRAMASAAMLVGVLTLIFLVGGMSYVNQHFTAPTRRPDPIVPEPPTIVRTAVSTSTMIINYTSTKTVLIQETRTAEPAVTTTATLLLPPPQSQRAPEKPVEGKGICSAVLYSPGEILLRMPHNTKLYWLAKDSISIELVRGDETIKAKFSSVDEGILIEVPRSEAHGVMYVSVVTTRRPKVNETFAVNFGKPFVGEIIDFGRLVAEDLSNYYAIASAESVRRAEQIKGTASEALKSVEESFNTASEEAKKTWRSVKDFGSSYLYNSLPGAQLRVTRLVEEWDRRARDVEDEMQLLLLQAQIRAKETWLRMKGDKKAHDAFVDKAKVYLEEKVADANWRRAQRDMEKQKSRREWLKEYRKGYTKGRKKGCLPWGRSDCEDA